MTRPLHCDDVLDKLPLYVGADLDEAGLSEVESHLQGCSTCRLAADRAAAGRQALVGAYSSLASEAREPALWEGIRNTLREEGRLQPGGPQETATEPVFELTPRPRLRLLRRAAPLVAAAAAACVLFFVSTGTPDAPTSAGDGRVAETPGDPTVLPLRRVQSGERALTETLAPRREVDPARTVQPRRSSNELVGYSSGRLGKLR